MKFTIITHVCPPFKVMKLATAAHILAATGISSFKAVTASGIIYGITFDSKVIFARDSVTLA